MSAGCDGVTDYYYAFGCECVKVRVSVYVGRQYNMLLIEGVGVCASVCIGPNESLCILMCLNKCV